jgi:ribonuclease HI
MTLHIYTDGGCSGNPGPGGWAYVIVQKTDRSETVLAQDCGGEPNTTNNRMELTAVIAALKTLKTVSGAAQEAALFTDSQYVRNGITLWIRAWKQNSWRTSGKAPVKNRDLWTELDALASELSVHWEWVKGHAGNAYNERCDALARSQFPRR